MTNSRIVLLVEDDEPKQRSVVAYLRDVLDDEVDVRVAESLSSAISVLSSVDVELAVVDMSIPTFDFVKDRRGGGQPQGFGGADILRFIDTETSLTKSVVLTQYEEFVLPRDGERRDPLQLEAVLKTELDSRFFGVIHYSGQLGPWRESLRQVLEQLNLLEKQ